jgi:hypothetical protein
MMLARPYVSECDRVSADMCHMCRVETCITSIDKLVEVEILTMKVAFVVYAVFAVYQFFLFFQGGVQVHSCCR